MSRSPSRAEKRRSPDRARSQQQRERARPSTPARDFWVELSRLVSGKQQHGRVRDEN
jgi:hypothetical protein